MKNAKSWIHSIKLKSIFKQKILISNNKAMKNKIPLF